MTEKEKKELYDCSIQGYLKYLKDNNYSSAKDALMGSIKYMLRYNVIDNLTTCSRDELMYVVKNEIAKMVAKEQINKDPNDLTNMQSKEDEKELKCFFTNPLEYVGIKLENRAPYYIDKKALNDDDAIDYAHKYNNNITATSSFFKIRGAKTVYDAYANSMGDRKAYFHIIQLESKLPNNSIDEAFNRQKPSFFEKFFKTTSNEYKNFKTAFDNYRDRNSDSYGNREVLENAAIAYLRHKFPNIKDNELPTMEQISTLSGAGKERAEFCLKVVENFRENAEIQEQANKMVKAVQNLDIDVTKEMTQANNPEFEQNVKNDVNVEFANENNNIIQNDEKNLNVDSIDNSNSLE